MPGAISFSGLFSGLDTESIISELMKIERQPITLLENKQLILNYQKEALNEINNSLISLKNIAYSFKSSSSSILKNTAISSDESILTATADITARKGVYDVVVNQLAKAHRIASDSKSSTFTAGNAANAQFKITVDETDYIVTVDAANATLAQIAAYINRDAGDVVTATIVTNPTTGNQTLSIESNRTGEKYKISFIEDLTGSVLYDIGVVGSLVEEYAPSDANQQYQVGDYAGDEYRQAQGFKIGIDSEINYVSLYLSTNYGTPTGPITIRIETDDGFGQPSGTLVDPNATTQIDESNVIQNSWNQAIFPASFSLSSGVTYHIVVSTEPQSDDSAYMWKARNPGTYDDGSRSVSRNGGPWSSPAPERDYLFKMGTNSNIKNQLQAAANAQLTVEGVEIESYTNQVTGAIQGVTMNLKDTGSVTVTVGLDEDSIVEKVNEFIDQFNSVTDLLAGKIKEEKVKNPESSEDYKYGVLRGDYDLASIKSQIRLLVTNNTDGLDVSGNPISGWSSDYRIMAQIGIESEPYYGGTVSDNLTLDESKLRNALSDNPEAVAALLEEVGDRINDYLQNQTKVSAVKEFAGNIYRRILGINERIRNIDEDILRLEESMEKIEERYRNSFNQMERYLQSLQDEGTYLTAQLNNLLNAASSSGLTNKNK